jgi:hypothetical protein
MSIGHVTAVAKGLNKRHDHTFIKLKNGNVYVHNLKVSGSVQDSLIERIREAGKIRSLHTNWTLARKHKA